MFLRLFVNHRPVYGISKNHIATALAALGTTKANGQTTISREELLKCLTSEGEKMTLDEIR